MTSSKSDSEKTDMVSNHPKSLFSTKTPNKTDKRQIFSSSPQPESLVKLPERFEILEEFFNGLDTAIRLLRLKGSLTTFTNICPKFEYLTNRIFSYDHLAQMKHIYPEAIELKRVLKYVESTCCMKPSLHINLNTDAIVLDGTSCGTKYMELRKVFHSKLVDFYKAHPKDEIPKELLPEPFNSPQRDSHSDTVSLDLGAPKFEVEGFDVHMEEVEQEEKIANKVLPDSTLSSGTKECLSSHKESRIVGTPVKDLSTPSKDLSTPIRVMSATPTLQLSRRCIKLTPESGDDNFVRSTNGLGRLAKGPSRSLNFDTLDEDAVVKDDIGNESNDQGINYEADDASDEDSLLQSVRGPSRSLNFDTLEEDAIVKDDISKESDDEGINYEANDASNEDCLLQSMKEGPKPEPEKHNLPKLVNLIHTLFHSTKRTVITKEELLHKIIASQIHITDRREVEEQLRLILQLVPDWISETKAYSEDVLVCINKMSAAETVRAKLEEATSQSQDISTVN